MNLSGMHSKDVFYKKLCSLVLPITIQQFMLALVSATDAVMLGVISQTALSAVSLAGQVQFVMNLFISGISVGASVMAAQYWGKRDTLSVEKIMPVALRANLLCGGIFTLATAVIPDKIMEFMTNDAALIASGSVYLRAVSLSYILCGISQVYLILLKNTDNAKISSVISSTAVLINIIVNAILIFGLLGFPAMGIAGAAYATVLARIIELVWSFAETKKEGRIPVRWSLVVFTDKRLAGDFWKYTFPILSASLVWGIAFFSYSVIMGHMGNDAVAANSIATITKNLTACLIRGVGGGVGIVIGNLLGQGKFQLAKTYGRHLTHLSIAVGVGTCICILLISPWITAHASLSETASVYLRQMLIICSINTIAHSINVTVLDGIFCAGGDSKFDVKCNMMGMWCLSVPVGFLAAFVLKLPIAAVYAIINLDEIVKIPAVYLHYKKHIWVRNITR